MENSILRDDRIYILFFVMTEEKKVAVSEISHIWTYFIY